MKIFEVSIDSTGTQKQYYEVIAETEAEAEELMHEYDRGSDKDTDKITRKGGWFSGDDYEMYISEKEIKSL